MSGETDRVKWRGVQPVAGISGVWPSVDATRVNKVGGLDGIGTAIIYTVPDNTKLYIAASGMFTRLRADGGRHASLFVQAAPGELVYTIIYHLYEIKGQQSSNMSFPIALEASAGWDVVVESFHADVDAYAVFFGWLEDV